MLMRTDPFRELDRLAQAVFGANGTRSHPGIMPMDAYRHDGQFIVHFDLPGVDPSSIDINVERNVLTVRAERKPAYGEDIELQAHERPRGTFSRQLFQHMQQVAIPDDTVLDDLGQAGRPLARREGQQ
jgi:HSP20 family protein